MHPPPPPRAQIQMRDVPGFVDTRHKLLIQKPANRANWIAFAVGHHLDGNHDLAAQILAAYESTLVREQPVYMCGGGGVRGVFVCGVWT